MLVIRVVTREAKGGEGLFKELLRIGFVEKRQRIGFLFLYKMMQVFLSLNGFSEVGIPISSGSLRACSSQ